MFWSNQNVYQFYPDEENYFQLKQEGYKIAVFVARSNYELPDYIANDPDVLILDKQLKWLGIVSGIGYWVLNIEYWESGIE